MELGPRPAYRSATARCPGCGETMRAEITSSAEVEVCDACGGIWLDWFDGEVQTLAAEAEAARVDRGTPPPGMVGTPVPRGGDGACPRCHRSLGLDTYRYTDAKDGELVSSVELLRCAECAGCFVPRPSAHLLLDRVLEGPPPSIGEALMALLRSLFRRR